MSTYTEAPSLSVEIIEQLKGIFAQQFGVPSNQLDPDESFVAMGADSLSLLQAANSLQNTFGVKVAFRLMVDEYPTIRELAAYVQSRVPRNQEFSEQAATSPEPSLTEPELSVDRESRKLHAEPVNSSVPGEKTSPASKQVQGIGLESLIAQQLEIMSAQLEILRQEPSRSSIVTGESPESTSNSTPAATAARSINATDTRPLLRSSGLKPEMEPELFVPHRPLNNEKRQLTLRQQQGLKHLINRLSQRTAGSKKSAQEYRSFLADNRSSAGFRLPWKEICYPLIIDHGQGSRVWDIDKNEYVDLTCGFGSLLFGHTPEFLLNSMHDQLDKGLGVGWQSPLAGKVAQVICELTGTDRAAFCNSGTEAVMGALRIARTATGRRKVAVFEGSYHGFFDGVLVKRIATAGHQAGVAPVAPGMSPGVLEDVIVLEYDNPESLRIIEEQASDIAGVIVEFPRSRRPDMHPGDFLQELRRVTSARGIVLIFDEVVTGFRFHPGGSQALFGVKADLITYGKALGGGVPIGVVAGNASLMSAIDGGMWRYGDESFPEAPTTFFAGTYFKHPLIMPALWACLNHLKASGPRLQQDLDQRTEKLVKRLNAFFEQESVPIQMIRFNSLFRFVFHRDIEYHDLFFYYMLTEGVYICETRSCFLSTAHTDEDLDLVFRAVQRSVTAMREAGLLGAAASEDNDDPAKRPANLDDQFPKSTDSPRSFPLTEGQRQLWTASQVDAQASIAYNLGFCVRFKGALKYEALRAALQALVNRHEALRIRFSTNGEEQIVSKTLSLDLPIHDLSRATEEEISSWPEQQAQQRFDFVNGPLIRAAVARLDVEEHLLVITVHHIIADGISMGIFFDELMALYQATCDSVEPALRQAGSFAEYAKRQSKFVDSAAGRDAEAYWRSLFENADPLVNLPTDYSRPPLRTFRGQRVSSRVGKNIAEEVNQLNSRYRCTSFMTLLAAFATTLSCISRQENLIIGVPAAGRMSADEDVLIGDCINLLPLPVRCSAGDTFGDVLANVKQLLLDSFEYQRYPLSRIIKDLGIRFDPSRPTLVPIFFNFERPTSSFSVAGLQAEIVPVSTGTSQFDLGLNIQQCGDAFLFDCDFYSDLFSRETVSKWLEYMVNVLHEATDHPDRKIGELTLASESERKRLIDEWGSGTVVNDIGLQAIESFEARVAQTPAALAVTGHGGRLSYAELNCQANRLARQLQSLGITSEMPVAVCMQRSAKSLVALLAVLKAGGCYMPLDPAWPLQRISSVLETSGAEFLLTDNATAEQFADFSGQLVRIERAISPGAADANPLNPIHPRQVAYIMHTSGSTGRPKGVVIEQRGMRNNLFAKIDDLNLQATDVVAQTAPVSFDISVWQFLAVLLVGGTVHILPDIASTDPARLIEELRVQNITALQVVPSMLRPILDELEAQPNAKIPLRWLISVGEELPIQLCRRWLRCCPDIPIVNVYGPTECSDHGAYHVIDRDPGAEAVRVSIGAPEANTGVYVLDREFNPCPIGVAGEIYVGGKCVCRGYLNDPRSTAERFLPDPFTREAGGRMYRTGDAARWRPNGTLDFLGRIDQQVKIRGFRIELGEIETMLCQHPGVSEAVAVAKFAKNSGQLIAYIVPRVRDRVPQSAELRQFLQNRLPEYMLPVAFVPLQHIPLNSNGKLDRKALPEPAGIAETREAFVAPRNHTEQILTEVWQQVLGLDKVSVHDNFFDLGGDSILSMQVVVGAGKRGLRLTPRDILRQPTIAGLAELADANSPAVNAEKIHIEEPERELTSITPIQHWFFEQQLPDPNHFNTMIMLEPIEKIDTHTLEKALRAVIAHHDALRTRFRRVADGWKQRICSPERGPITSLTRFDLSQFSGPARQSALEEQSARLQRTLDIQNGPLLRAAWFDFGRDSSARFLLILHHLVMDVVSWPILMDSLETAYRQISQGRPVDLGPKTTSFAQWTELLNAYAQGPALRAEYSYWLNPEARDVRRLPVDFPEGENTEASADRVLTNLDSATTRALLFDLPKRWGMQVHELLLAALARALANWAGHGKILMHVEGHGRELLFDDVDLTRTIGWFTVVSPMLVNFEGNLTIAEQLMRVKKRLRSLPNGGIGHGLLRYLGPEEIRQQLRELPEAEIAVNYLGRLDLVNAGDSLFRQVDSPCGSTGCPNGRRRYLIDLNGGISQGSLQLAWSFSNNLHRRQTIEQLEEGFRFALEEMLAEQSRPDEIALTASALQPVP